MMLQIIEYTRVIGQAAGQTPTSIGNEKNTMCYRIGFYFNIIYCPITCSIPNLIFSLFPSTTGKTCSGGLVLFGCGVKNGFRLHCGKLVHKCLLELVYLSGVTNLY